MSDAAGLTGRHTNHSVRRTMISTLRKENVEAINIIGFSVQRNINSLNCYSSTSTARNKPVLESQILTPRTQELFHSRLKMKEKICSLELFLTTASSPLLLPMPLATRIDHAAIPVKKFKRILPLIDSNDELRTNFCYSFLSRLNVHYWLKILS